MLARPLSVIRAAHPGLSTNARAIVEALCLAEGSIGSSTRVAQALGLRNRFELGRMLVREGLPTLHCMTKWLTVLSWVETAERERVSLCKIAFRVGRYPGTCYRMVKEVTGQSWQEVRARGSGWVEQAFLRELRNRASDAGSPRDGTSLLRDSCVIAVDQPSPRIGRYTSSLTRE